MYPLQGGIAACLLVMTHWGKRPPLSSNLGVGGEGAGMQDKDELTGFVLIWTHGACLVWPPRPQMPRLVCPTPCLTADLGGTGHVDPFRRGQPGVR